jgi:membrane fusion protein, multidrug efflux system
MLNKLSNLITYLCLLASFLIITNSYANFPPQTILVETQKIEKRQLKEIFKTVGQVQNINSKNFFAKVEGTLDVKADKAYGEVKKGDLILAINFNIAETMKSQAELSYKITKAKFDKDQKLFKNNVITEDALNKSKLEVENTKLNLDKALQTYQHMLIKAPFDGRIGIIKQNLDEEIKVGDFLFTIVSPGYKEIVAALPQRLHKQVSQDSQIYLIDDYKKYFLAKITSISPYINKDTGNFELRLELEDNDNIFMHGSYSDIEVTYNIHEGLVLPESAISRDDQGSFAYIAKDGKAAKKYLELGTKIDGVVEILNSDLTTEDEIVVEGLTKVSDGAQLNIKAQEDKIE